MLELVEEALDEVALFVQLGVVGPGVDAVALGRDHWLGAPGNDVGEQLVGIVGLVGQDVLGFEALDQLAGSDQVVFLARTAQKARWLAACVGGDVDLGAQAAARAAQTLGIRPPFLRRAPAAC